MLEPVAVSLLFLSASVAAVAVAGAALAAATACVCHGCLLERDEPRREAHPFFSLPFSDRTDHGISLS